MKPQLLDDVQFVPQPGSVFVVVPARADKGFRLVEADAYEWLRRLAPFLTGEHTVDDLVGGLDEGRRARARSLLALLHREGAVRDAATDLPHTLSTEVRHTYARVIGFIARGGDSAEHRFQRYHESAPVVVGSGPLAAALVPALLATGVDRVRFVPTAEHPTDLARLSEVLALTVAPDVERRLRIDDWPAVESAAAPCGGVLHASAPPVLARGARLAGWCAARDVPFGQVTVVGDRALVGPVGTDGRLQSRWSAELERLAADCPGGPVSTYLAGPAAAAAANHLCAAFLKHVTGVSPDPGRRFVEVDLETLRTAVRTW
jgi:hypothetical protein